jgi:hypothetical protein
MAASPTTLATCIVRDTVIESTSTDAGQVPLVTFPHAGPGEGRCLKTVAAIGRVTFPNAGPGERLVSRHRRLARRPNRLGPSRREPYGDRANAQWLRGHR